MDDFGSLFHNLARENRSRRKTLHGNQEKGREEEEETLTGSETISLGPESSGLSKEAPFEGLFHPGQTAENAIAARISPFSFILKLSPEARSC